MGLGWSHREKKLPDWLRRARAGFGLLACLGILWGDPARAIKSGLDLDITGTYVVYIVEARTFQATEKARLLLPTLTITADSMTVDLQQRGLKAIGGVVVQPAYSLSAGLSGGKTLEGDTLYYDLDSEEGSLYQFTDTGLSRQLFHGQGLEEVASIRSGVERFSFVANTALSPINFVGNRVRVEEDGNFQAWNVAVYVKGNKAMSVPYYNSDAKTAGATGFALNRVDFDSRSKWNLGGHFRYKKNGRFRGRFTWGYRSTGNQKYSLGLSQNFALNKKVSGVLDLTGLGEAERTYRASINASLSRISRMTVGLTKPQEGRLSTSLDWSRFASRTDQQLTWDNAAGLRSTSLRWGLRAQHLKRLGLGYDLRINLNDRQYGGASDGLRGDLSTNWYKSQVNLGKKSWLNLSSNLGFSFGNGQGYNSGFNARVSRRLGVFSQLTLGHSASYANFHPSRGAETNSHGAASNVALAVGGQKKWSLRSGANFDWNRTAFTTGTLSLTRILNSKLELSHNLYYDLKRGEPTSDTYSLAYKILGIRARFYWHDNDGRFAFSFDSPF